MSECGIEETDYLAAQAVEGDDVDARRRLLADARAKKKASTGLNPEKTKSHNFKGAAIILAGVVPIAAVSLYLVLGRPDYSQADKSPIPEAPSATEMIAQMPEADRAAMIENMVAGLADRLAENPE